jgi:hypothetical protein
MTMMKYYVDDDGEIDMEALWAYEGVVLPGNRIVLGRWWSPDDDHLDNVSDQDAFCSKQVMANRA